MAGPRTTAVRNEYTITSVYYDDIKSPSSWSSGDGWPRCHLWWSVIIGVLLLQLITTNCSMSSYVFSSRYNSKQLLINIPCTSYILDVCQLTLLKAPALPFLLLLGADLGDCGQQREKCPIMKTKKLHVNLASFVQFKVDMWFAAH